MNNTSISDYHKSLPKKRMGSGVIIRNEKGEILILKTTYKDHWEIPGGVVEENESPVQTAERETLEEIGVKLNIDFCLVMHYRSAQLGIDENIMFVFDGGLVKNIDQLKLDPKEIAEAKFISFNDALTLVGDRLGSRLPFCEQALKEKRTIYLESVGEMMPRLLS